MSLWVGNTILQHKQFNRLGNDLLLCGMRWRRAEAQQDFLMPGSGQQGHNQLGLFFWKINLNKTVLLSQSKEIIPDCFQFAMRGLLTSSPT